MTILNYKVYEHFQAPLESCRYIQNLDYSNSQFIKTPDSSNQKFFPYIWICFGQIFYPRFLELTILRTKFSFPGRFKKSVTTALWTRAFSRFRRAQQENKCCMLSKKATHLGRTISRRADVQSIFEKGGEGPKNPWHTTCRTRKLFYLHNCMHSYYVLSTEIWGEAST